MAISAARPLPSQASELDAHLQHGDMFASAGQVAPALAMYRMAATQCELTGELGRALAIHARIARLDPDPGMRARIAELQLHLGQRPAAANTFDGVARDQLRLGRVPHALAAAAAALAAEPTRARRWQLAGLARSAGQLELAVEQLKALAVDELAAGQHVRSQSLCRRALQLAPGHAATLRVAVDAFLRGRDAHRAVECIRELLRIDPDDRVALEGIAEAFALLGNKDRGAEALRLLALRLGAQGPEQRDDARALVRRAISWRPGDEALRTLERELEASADAAAASPAERTRVIDIGDLIQLPPARRPATPPRRPPPVRRTDAYANR
jgi:tetratricopeptide (TPR) repeat protein